MGGVDGALLPIVCEHLGITDPGLLLDRLLVIRAHKPPKDDDPSSD